MIFANPTLYKRDVLSNSSTAFMFDSITNFNKFVEEGERIATGNARTGINEINSRSYVRDLIQDEGERWFGTTDANVVRNNLDVYLFNNQLQTFLDNFRNNTINLDIIDIDQQKSIKFTEKEVGIFSFDLASLGLIRVYEYYSPLLKDIVSPNLVISEVNESGQRLFYHVYTPYVPKHKVEYDGKQGGYYSTILKRIVRKDELIEIVTNNDIYFVYPERAEIPQHIVEQRQQLDENGRKKFSSTFKKSFIDLPKVEKPLPRIDIIAMSSFPYGVNARDEMIYSSMAAIAIAEKLSKSGINYRFLAAYPTETVNANDKIYPFVVLKKEGEPFDKNKIASMLSDARMYRYQIFKAKLLLQNDAGYDAGISPTGIGRPIRDSDEVKAAYMQFLSMQDNPEDRKAAENPRSKIVFNSTLNEQDAIAEYNRVITEISRV